jgi:hypothetical protein
VTPCRGEDLTESLALLFYFQPSQIAVEIPFDLRCHQEIRETIKCASGSLNSDHRKGRASIQRIKLVRHVHREWAFDRFHDHEMIRFQCPYLKNVIDGRAQKFCSPLDLGPFAHWRLRQEFCL